ncbi:hypothetical protein O181_029326 [Austropuccinia psidii MF-1]|uniref:Reverse transcriptase Ty1/copia-type domain-containing protein n=1 Tax=Austropuccinia psidii MF-1 TaxID=1389203 RepID=A0A9Q3H372_9BASI|nr:hypothetical protein [Austropuccinia psidii MF-1]
MPEQNAFSERGNRSILENKRCLMQTTELTDQFWAEAMSTETFLLNSEPKKHELPPYERWFGTKPPVESLWVFGCKAWTTSNKDDVCSALEDEYHDVVEEQPSRRIMVIGPRHPTLITGDISSKNILPYRRRVHQTYEATVPKNYQQAINSEQWVEWEKVITKELDNMGKLKVRSIRDKNPNDQPISCTWVFKTKKNEQQQIIKHKSRLCAQGFHQIQGLDYSQTFSQTGRISSLQEFILNVAINNYQFHQMDVKSTFLNAPLD